jgi:hypothetical protein
MATRNPPNRLAEIAGLRKMTEPPQTPYERFLAAAKIGKSYYVRATLPDGTFDRIEGLGEAARWIKNEAVVWLNARSS